MSFFFWFVVCLLVFDTLPRLSIVELLYTVVLKTKKVLPEVLPVYMVLSIVSGCSDNQNNCFSFRLCLVFFFISIKENGRHITVFWHNIKPLQKKKKIFFFLLVNPKVHKTCTYIFYFLPL